MVKRIKKLCFLMIVCCSSVALEANQKHYHELAHVWNVFEEALNNANVIGISEFYGKNAIYISSINEPIEGQQEITSWYTKRYKTEQYHQQSTIDEITFLSSKWVIMRIHTDGDKTITHVNHTVIKKTFSQNIFLILEKDTNGRWHIIRHVTLSTEY